MIDQRWVGGARLPLSSGRRSTDREDHEMPIRIGKKKFTSFAKAVAYVKRARPNVKSPKGYVATIERKERKG